ncbi:MAG: hypothetical protein ACOCQR_00740 [bacterium]
MILMNFNKLRKKYKNCFVFELVPISTADGVIHEKESYEVDSVEYLLQIIADVVEKNKLDLFQTKDIDKIDELVRIVFSDKEETVSQVLNAFLEGDTITWDEWEYLSDIYSRSFVENKFPFYEDSLDMFFKKR